MLTLLKMTIAGAFTVVLLLLPVWLIQGNNFFLYKVFAPQYEQVRRETFEQSKAYTQGMAQHLAKQMQEYQQTTPENKDSLATLILHEYADYNLLDFQPYQRAFIEKLRRGER